MTLTATRTTDPIDTNFLQDVGTAFNGNTRGYATLQQLVGNGYIEFSFDKGTAPVASAAVGMSYAIYPHAVKSGMSAIHLIAFGFCVRANQDSEQIFVKDGSNYIDTTVAYSPNVRLRIEKTGSSINFFTIVNGSATSRHISNNSPLPGVTDFIILSGKNSCQIKNVLISGVTQRPGVLDVAKNVYIPLEGELNFSNIQPRLAVSMVNAEGFTWYFPDGSTSQSETPNKTIVSAPYTRLIRLEVPSGVEAIKSLVIPALRRDGRYTPSDLSKLTGLKDFKIITRVVANSQNEKRYLILTSELKLPSSCQNISIEPMFDEDVFNSGTQAETRISPVLLPKEFDFSGFNQLEALKIGFAQDTPAKYQEGFFASNKFPNLNGCVNLKSLVLETHQSATQPGIEGNPSFLESVRLSQLTGCSNLTSVLIQERGNSNYNEKFINSLLVNLAKVIGNRTSPTLTVELRRGGNLVIVPGNGLSLSTNASSGSNSIQLTSVKDLSVGDRLLLQDGSINSNNTTLVIGSITGVSSPFTVTFQSGQTLTNNYGVNTTKVYNLESGLGSARRLQIQGHNVRATIEGSSAAPVPIPTVIVSAPANATTGTVVTLGASASIDNDTIESVQFRINGTDLNAPDTTSPYNTNWTPTIPGNYSVTALAKGTKGGTALSSSITVVVSAPNSPTTTSTTTAAPTTTSTTTAAPTTTSTTTAAPTTTSTTTAAPTTTSTTTAAPTTTSTTTATPTTTSTTTAAPTTTSTTTAAPTTTSTTTAAPTNGTLFQLVWTGQSNGAGNMETADLRVLSSSPTSADNRMLTTGVRAANTGNTSLISLVEAEQPDPNSANTFLGETGASACLTWLRQFGNIPANSVLVATNWARSGFAYSQIRKTTAPYNDGLAQVQAVKNLATSLGMAHRIIAVVNIHGEQDQVSNTANYAANLAQFQIDLETDYKAITGQSEAIPLFACQQNGYSPAQAASIGVATAIELYKAHKANPNKVIAFSPKYQYSYHAGGVGVLHLTAHDQRWHGETVARAIDRMIFRQLQFDPLMPASVTMSAVGNIIELTLKGNAGNNVGFDLRQVVAPNNTALGFEYSDNSGVTLPTITNVEIVGANVIRITLSSAPTGTTRELRYAYTASETASTGGGRWSGARGNVFVESTIPSSNYGYPGRKWLLQFVETITLT